MCDGDGVVGRMCCGLLSEERSEGKGEDREKPVRRDMGLRILGARYRDYA